MKKQLFTICAAMLIALTSCKKDDTTPASTFVLDANDLKGDILDGTVTLKSGTTYKLTGALTVKLGATLTIEPGTIIEAQTALGATTLFVTIERGARIDARGTEASPITFTSTGTAAGSWGGLIICGKAPNNIGIDAQSEITGVVYGGSNAADNSGTVQYVVIKNSGSKINATKEFNGLSLFSCGTGTTLDHIASINGNDDAFEFYGGTVNASYLYAANNDDDNFDFDEGYVGTLNYCYGINTNLNASSDSRGIEGDGNPTNFVALPLTNPTITNVSLIGRGSAAVVTSGVQNEAVKLRRGMKGQLSNIFMQGYKQAVGVEHDETIAFVAPGSLKLTTGQIVDCPTKTVGKNTAGAAVDVSAVLVEGTTTGAGAGAAKPTWAAFVK
jgi:hypothetical protein